MNNRREEVQFSIKGDRFSPEEIKRLARQGRQVGQANLDLDLFGVLILRSLKIDGGFVSFEEKGTNYKVTYCNEYGDLPSLLIEKETLVGLMSRLTISGTLIIDA